MGVLLLIGAIWFGVMVCLWFPDIVPFQNVWKRNFANKSKVPDKGINRPEVFQMLRYNATTLKNIVHVCITSDENTLGGMIALINSIDQNSKQPVMYHLVVDKESVVHLKTWIANSRLHDTMHEIKIFPEEWVKGKIKIRGGRQELGSPLNYARYYLPRLFPDLDGRIIFIDDDSIVLGDISQLYNIEIRPGHGAAFAQDCMGSAKRVTMMKEKLYIELMLYIISLESSPKDDRLLKTIPMRYCKAEPNRNIYNDYIDFKNKHVKDKNIDPLACAFNTGVYVTDLSYWRKNNITEQLEYWMELNTKEEVYGNEKGGGGSQPPMMLVFYNKYTPLDPMWHVRYLGWTRGTSYTLHFLKKANLLHWNGKFKPWGRTAQHSEIWDKYFIEDPTGEFVPIRKN